MASSSIEITFVVSNAIVALVVGGRHFSTLHLLETAQLAVDYSCERATELRALEESRAVATIM